jgi:hypothetical protein
MSSRQTQVQILVVEVLKGMAKEILANIEKVGR